MRKLSVALIFMITVTLLGVSAPGIKAGVSQTYWAKTSGGGYWDVSSA